MNLANNLYGLGSPDPMGKYVSGTHSKKRYKDLNQIFLKRSKYKN